MTIHLTPLYGIAYVDTDTAVVDLAAASQQAATTIEQALTRGGVVPPGAADLTAEAATRAAADTALSARVNTLEGSGPTAPTYGSGWSDYGSGLSPLQVWKVGKTAFVSGLVKNAGAVGASTTSVIATMPAGYAPAATVLTPQHYDGINACRVDVQANGQIVLNTALMSSGLAAGRFITVNAFWRLP